MEKVRAKKNLGQHFLKDLSIARRIVASLPADTPTPVLEIGPGMGVLTQYLLENPNVDLKVVELDGESVRYLQKNFPKLEGRIIPADFLKLRLEDYFPSKFCIIGNYPYNISSQIFFKLLEYREQVPVLTGMVQKEVAERIASKEGSKAYGILSVLLQAYYDIEYLFTVDERVFDPPPKVKSAVIRLTRNNVTDIGCDETLFRRVVKTAFNQRRKTLRNSLRPILKPETPTQDDIFGKRPEQLSVREFIDLTNRLGNFVVS
ncbi:MAG: 16S rRNA (adenine(1518)-N(6)/adenine(1519)-N(6))-dimethyltransferase RsmA [Bacteroidales bacterium]|nr:16S rRNA (adenine(1518)-N(6)/adenine(1519)-N(6))-dimethyltransferase RsmA [Bacteroidales bacterium]